MLFLFVLVISVLLNSVDSLVYSNTVNGELCMTDCKVWTGHREYCWKNWNHWDYCQSNETRRPLYYASRKNGKAVECESLCGKFGENYNWCWTDVVNSDWDYCSVENGKSSLGYTCVTPCLHRKDRHYSCFAASLEKRDACTDHCSPGPFNYDFMGYMESAIAESCARCSVREIRVRQRDAQEQMYCDTRWTWGMERVALNYEKEFGATRIDWDPNNQPVTSYVTMRPPPVKGYDDVNITLVIKAVITEGHINLASKTPAYRQMTDLETGYDDVPTRLLPQSLGGPNSGFNVASLSNTLSSISGQWTALEYVIMLYLQRNPGNRVEWTLVLGYNLEKSRRPTYLGLVFREYDSSGNLTFSSNDCIFSN